MTILVVAAVAAERDAVVRDLGVAEPVEVGGLAGVAVATPAGTVHAFAAGVGPVAAAGATARLLALGPEYSVVLSAGIAGGFRDRAPVGCVVVADRITFADLGTRVDAGVLTPRQMGLSQDNSYAASANDPVAARLARAPVRVVRGEILTLSCMTGTQADAETLAHRFPHAVAEAMEGFGVVDAALSAPGFAGLTGEIRAVSNTIGPRDPSTWEISRAFDALAAAFATLAKEALL